MQIFLRTWQEHWLINNLAQLPTQSKFLHLPNTDLSLSARKNISLTQIYRFPQGKLELSLAKPDKDKYDTRDKKQHNLQQLIKQPGPA